MSFIVFVCVVFRLYLLTILGTGEIHLSEMTGQKNDKNPTPCNPFERKFKNTYEREKINHHIPFLPAHHEEVEVCF